MITHRLRADAIGSTHPLTQKNMNVSPIPPSNPSVASIACFLVQHHVPGMARFNPSEACIEVAGELLTHEGYAASEFPPVQLRTLTDARNWLGY